MAVVSYFEYLLKGHERFGEKREVLCRNGKIFETSGQT
jgi:hypothetical protein